MQDADALRDGGHSVCPPAFRRERFDVWAPQADLILRTVGHLAFIAGGAARQLALEDAGPPAEDIDLFMRDSTGPSVCRRLLEAEGYRFDITSARPELQPFAITMYPPNPMRGLPVQIIRPARDRWSCTFGSPEDVIGHFSFTTEQFAVIRGEDGDELVTGAGAVEDTRERILRVANVTAPASCALRATKYVAKGYSITLEEMRRIVATAIERRQV